MTLVPLKPRGALGECVLPVPKTSGSSGPEILEGRLLPGDPVWVPVNLKLYLLPVLWGSLHQDTCTQGTEVHPWGRSWPCCTMAARRVGLECGIFLAGNSWGFLACSQQQTGHFRTLTRVQEPTLRPIKHERLGYQVSSLHLLRCWQRVKAF